MKNLLAGVLNIAIFSGAAAIYVYNMDEVRAEQIAKGFEEKEIHCLQQNIYFEARNQSTLGQVSVAWVTLNRMESPKYPDTICEVVWQRKQFSWTTGRKVDEISNNILDQKAWEQAGKVASKVLEMWARGTIDPTSGADHYHANYVEPYWADRQYKTVSIDDHVFYKLVR